MFKKLWPYEISILIYTMVLDTYRRIFLVGKKIFDMSTTHYKYISIQYSIVGYHKHILNQLVNTYQKVYKLSY